MHRRILLQVFAGVAVTGVPAFALQPSRRDRIVIAGGGILGANIAYRLIRYGDARRILFLVDRANLGRQTLKEFQAFTVPEENRGWCMNAT